MTTLPPADPAPAASSAPVSSGGHGIARYVVLTLVLGVVGVPLLVSLGVLAVFIIFSPAASEGWFGLLGLVVSLPVWFFWARRADRPARWMPALGPVLAGPLVLLAVWVVSWAVTGSASDALATFGLAGAPYFIATIFAAMTGSILAIPLALLAVLAGSWVGFVAGSRGRPLTARRGLWVLLTITLALVLAAGVQARAHVMNALLLSGEPSMEAEVPLWEYEPFAEGNRLVTPDTPPQLHLTQPLPRLDGATALYPVYGAIVQATYPAPGPDEEQWRFVETYAPCSTTPTAYDRLIGGEAEAIFVLQPSAGQRARAEAAGRTLEVTPIGREAFVFFVNTANPVEDLTLDQVRDIYSRRVINWRELGGSDEPIIAFQRPEDSGSQTAMLAMVMNDRPIAEPLREERIAGMGGIISEVAGYRDITGAIGYSFRWYATEMNSNPNVKMLSIDGVAPTVENIRSGAYPLVGDLNIVTAGTNNPNVRALIDWTLGPQGQALIEKVGYVGR